MVEELHRSMQRRLAGFALRQICDTMYEVMEFALDNALIEIQPGELHQQREGIPMGDPISPAMTIGALAWMERRWMRDTVEPTAKRNFMARRYMDDILLFYAENQCWDSAKMVADFEKSECYDSPLKLEEGGQGTFLETSFEIKENCDAQRIDSS